MERPPRRIRWAALTMGAVLAVLFGQLGAATPAAASLPASHTFDGWQNGTLGEPEFLIAADSEVRRDGPIALRVDYSSPQAGTGRYAHLFQDVLVQPGQTYTFSAWVRAEDVSATGAFYFVLSGDHQQRTEVPGGSYDWEQLTWEYTVPTNQSSFRMRILARGPGTVWFDNLSMTLQGSSQNLLANPSFDLFQPPPGALRFSDETLVYQPGQARVGVETEDTEVDWSLRADSGQTVADGTAPVSDGSTVIDLGDQDPGYYTLQTSVDEPEPATRTATLAVVEPRSEHHTSDHPFGLSMHARRHSVEEVEQLLQPMGLGMVRENPAWSDIEKTPGVYDFTGHYDDQIQAAIARGERPLVITPLSNPLYDDNETPGSPEAIAAYAEMAGALAEHYGDAVDYEIYNEFNHTGNNGPCGRTPECYLELLEPTAAAIRQSVPDARIVAPGTAGLELEWIGRLVELGGLEHLDVLSFHAYDIPRAPEGETETEIAALRKLLDDNGGADVPIWMSEHGWHTQVGGVSEQLQAAYTVRSATLLHAAGVERVLYYTMTDSGLDPAEKEHNFGLVRSNLGVNSALAPKPGYVAFSVFNRVTAGLRLEGVQQVGGAHVATFSAPGRPDTRTVWAADGETLQLQTPEPVEVVEPAGRTWTSDAGHDLQLAVGEQPVHVVGEVGSVTVAEEPFLTVDTPEQVALGDGPEVPVTLDGGALGVSGPVGVRGTAGEEAAVSAGDEPATAALELAGFEEEGLVPWRVAASTASGLVALRVGELDVVDNPALEVVPSVDPGSGEPVTSLRVRNLEGAPAVTMGDIEWQLGDRSGTTAGVTVADGEETVVELARGAAELWQPFEYTVSTEVDGRTRQITGDSVVAPVVPRGAAQLAEADWREHGRWVSLGSPEPETAADLGGGFHLEWDAEGLTVIADVTDEDHQPGRSAAELWAGDSLQLAASPGLPGSSTARAELGAALLPDGPVVQSFTAPAGPVPGASAVVERDDAAGTTAYQVTVPWDALGVGPDEPFSFSMVLNDNDAGVREGYLEWGSGIGGRKETGFFLPLTLLAEPDPRPTLTSLLVDGVPVPGFDPTDAELEVSVGAGAPVPRLTGTASHERARVRVDQATAVPGTATVRVVGPGGIREYRVHLVT